MAYSSNNSQFLPGMVNQNRGEEDVNLLGITTVTDAVSNMNKGLLHDVQLVQTKDINMVPGELPMFMNFKENAVKGILITLALFLSFYGIQFVTEYLARIEIISPWIGCWMPLFIFVFIGYKMIKTIN